MLIEGIPIAIPPWLAELIAGALILILIIVSALVFNLSDGEGR